MNVIKKLKQTVSLFKHRNDSKFINAESYYPEEPRKTKFHIFLDQLSILWKYGTFESFYFTYGFDRECITREIMFKEYLLPYSAFLRQTKYLNWNNNPKYGWGHGSTIVADKYYFYIFLSHVGIPTPRVLLYINNHEIQYINKNLTFDECSDTISTLKSFLQLDMDAFCKPSDGQLGNGIFALTIKDGRCYVDNELFETQQVINLLLSANYLIQERIYQHPKMAALCSSTINSIRLQTVMDSQGNVIPFGAGLRMGRQGSRVDNWAKGGVFVGIDMRSGRLKDRGFLKPKFGTSVFEHPDTHIKFLDYEIPYYQEAVNMAVKMHKHLYRCHSIGWDIAITENGPIFIEGNSVWEISLLQAAHGGLKKQIAPYFDL